jgi:hypothetical protein
MRFRSIVRRPFSEKSERMSTRTTAQFQSI